jgi:hypothetical protein
MVQILWFVGADLAAVFFFCFFSLVGGAKLGAVRISHRFQLTPGVWWALHSAGLQSL